MVRFLRLILERHRMERSLTDWLSRVFGPTGHGSLAQGLPWENRSNVTGPEGAPRLRDVVPGRLVGIRPLRASDNNPEPRVNRGLSSPGPSGRGNMLNT
jgi:hypothetical protein